MSFGKATDLLRLAEMAASRHVGISLSDIAEEFGCDYRTAQRMVRALESTFNGVETRVDDTQRKYWSLRSRDMHLITAQGLQDSELVALEMSVTRAERDGAVTEAAALRRIRDRLLAVMPKPHARRTEADAEAILEAHGFACRPGPRVAADQTILSTLSEALRGPFQIVVTYDSRGDGVAAERLLQPYGVLLGVRRYLVANLPEEGNKIRHFRLDRIASIRLEQQSFLRDPAFNLTDHAARAFGSFQSDADYGDVVWRFTPAAAKVARDFVFHPQQVLTDEPDGSLTVRFRASGHLEMAWHLYCWGDGVEVLEPPALRDMVDPHRRPDFPAYP